MKDYTHVVLLQRLVETSQHTQEATRGVREGGGGGEAVILEGTGLSLRSSKWSVL